MTKRFGSANGNKNSDFLMNIDRALQNVNIFITAREKTTR